MTNFLYPFLDAEERDQDALLRDLAASAAAKAAESAALRASTLDANRELIATAAAEMARRFAAGGRMFAFGNGGSSTDVATLVALFARPPVGEPLPAWSLAADQAILTALGNDVGFDLVFARQLIARAGPGDIAVAMSTSGSSARPHGRVPRGPRAAACSRSGSPGTTAASSRRRPMWTSASPCAARASTGSRRRRRSWVTRCGPPVSVIVSGPQGAA